MKRIFFMIKNAWTIIPFKLLSRKSFWKLPIRHLCFNAQIKFIPLNYPSKRVASVLGNFFTTITYEDSFNIPIPESNWYSNLMILNLKKIFFKKKLELKNFENVKFKNFNLKKILNLKQFSKRSKKRKILQSPKKKI